MYIGRAGVLFFEHVKNVLAAFLGALYSPALIDLNQHAVERELVKFEISKNYKNNNSITVSIYICNDYLKVTTPNENDAIVKATRKNRKG